MTKALKLKKLAAITLGGLLTKSRATHFASPTCVTLPPVTVTRNAGSQWDLRVIATPGHTPTSVSLYDEQRHQLFLGDFMYPGTLYAFLPGASRGTYLATTRQLLAMLDPGTRIYTAHMADPPAPVTAPVLDVADLRALEATLLNVEQGKVGGTGFYPRIYSVRGVMTFATGFPWNNR